MLKQVLAGQWRAYCNACSAMSGILPLDALMHWLREHDWHHTGDRTLCMSCASLATVHRHLSRPYERTRKHG